MSRRIKMYICEKTPKKPKKRYEIREKCKKT